MDNGGVKRAPRGGSVAVAVANGAGNPQYRGTGENKYSFIF